ncbi:MAG: lysine-2,3-aminomutase-like protein [Hyphomicrobiaceae bacterium]
MNSIAQLLEAGLVARERADELGAVAARYAVAVTPAMAALIGEASDPIGRQFIPDPRELDVHPAEMADPIGDHDKTVVPGLVHRYPDRVLFKVSGVCPVYCRFCFRREMVGPGAGTTLGADEIAAAIGYVREHAEVWEVIITGGDPLILSPRRIAEIGAALGAIEHVKVIRWHTRVPVVAPERVTDEMVAALKVAGKAVYVGVHANHARELTGAARAALGRLVDGGIVLVSQTVLLAGVNDDVGTLEALMRAFVEARVTPYYLHHGDLATGTAHFRTTIARGQAIMRALRGRLSGIAQPTYVLDIPGAYGKVPIGEGNVVAVDDGGYWVTDPAGGVHRYEDALSADALALPP